MDESGSGCSRSAPTGPGPVLFESLEQRLCLATAVWDGGPSGTGTSWHSAVNWAGDVLPASGDDVIINAGSGVEYTAGDLTLLTLFSSKPLSIRGGALRVSSGASVSDQLTLDGGTLGGAGSWLLSGPGLHATSAAGNTLAEATIHGDLSLAVDDAFIRVTGGLTVNGLVTMLGPGAAISFEGGTQVFAGTADIVFAGFTGTRYISADAGAVLTLGSSVGISGELGKLVSGRFSGTGAIVNQGTIWADAIGGSIEVGPSTFTNLGTLRATNFATLRINAGTWTTSGVISINSGTIALGGTFDITSGFGTFSRTGGEVFIEGTILNTNSTLTLSAVTGDWKFGGGQILGGTINVSTAGTLGVFPSRAGRLAQVAVNGNLSWTASNTAIELDGVILNGNLDFGTFSTLTIKNNLVLNGTLTINGAETLLQFTGAAQSISGAATILLRDEDAYLWGIDPVTIASGATVSGYGRIFGDVVNAGSVIADTPAKTLLIGHGSFINEGSVSVTTGSRLWIGETIGGEIEFVNEGTLTASGASTLAVGPSSFSGPIDFSNSGTINITGASSLTVGWLLIFSPISVQSSGEINVTSGSTMIVGTTTATIPVTLSNSGVVRSQSGSTVAIRTNATTQQLGDLRADGGAVNISGIIDNQAATLSLSAVSGVWNLNGGEVRGGNLSQLGGGLSADSSTMNALQGVTLTGAMSLSQVGARLMVRDGLTLNGSLTISGQNAVLWFNTGSQLVQGSGQIVFAGSADKQSMSADAGAVVTLGTGITVSGDSGTAEIRSGLVASGSGSFVNQGLITGSLLVNTSSFSNSGIVEARPNTTLSIQGSVTNYSAGVLTGGSWRVGQSAQLAFGPGSITANHAAITLDGADSAFPALSSLNANTGTLKLSGGRALSLPGHLINSGTIELGPGTNLAVTTAFVQAGGTLKLSIDGGAPPTLTAHTARVGGALHVAWVKGHAPTPGTVITFLTAQIVRGRFATFSPQHAGLAHSLVYSPTSVAISTAAPPGSRL